MRRIYKYDLPEMGTGSIRQMPKGARILSLHTQNGRPKIWAIVDPETELVDREIVTVGTGFVLDEMFERKNAKFVGTFLVENEMLVFHVFDFGEV